MTLRAVRIARGRKPNRSPMIGVAGSARGREHLRRMMHGAVMTYEAFLIADFFVEETHRGGMARGALLGENRVRG